MSRKVRSDSKLDALAHAVQDGLFNVCRRDGFQGGLDWLAKTHKTHSTMSSLHSWYHRQAHQRQRDRFMRSRMETDAIMEAAGKLGDINQALAADFQQRAFEAMLAAADDPAAAEAVKELVTLSLKLQGHQLDVEKVQQDRERLELRVRQLEDASAAAKGKLTKAAKDGSISKETRQQIEEAAGLL